MVARKQSKLSAFQQFLDATPSDKSFTTLSEVLALHEKHKKLWSKWMKAQAPKSFWHIPHDPNKQKPEDN